MCRAPGSLKPSLMYDAAAKSSGTAGITLILGKGSFVPGCPRLVPRPQLEKVCKAVVKHGGIAVKA